MIVFAYPLAFLLLLLPFIFRGIISPMKGVHGDALEVPDNFINAIKSINSKSGYALTNNFEDKKNHLKLMFLYLIWALLVSAVAKPQMVGEAIPLRSQNREILMVLDISNSMLEPDFAVNNRRIDRLTIVKKTISEFLKKRANDKIGLIVFATNAYLQSPMTFDKKSVEEILWTVDAGMAGNSTAIGDALGLALKTLRQGTNLDRKVIILLTDGENNDGSLNLAEVISLAKKEGIKIYTIGVGSEGSLIQSMFGFNIKVGNTGLDEKSLKEIAAATKGTYFRASDTKGLEDIYNKIDGLEPENNEDNYIREVTEYYYIPLIAALIFASFLIFISRRLQR